MKKMTDFEKILKAAINSTVVAGKLADPGTVEAQLKKLKIEPTPKKLAALKACVKPMRKAYDAFDGQLDPG